MRQRPPAKRCAGREPEARTHVIGPRFRSVTHDEVVSPTQTRVLLVEKDRIVRELLESVLEHAGRRVDSTTTLRAAIDAAKQAPPVDVALIESRLPDGSGLELARGLKELDPTTEVLLMSAAPSLEAVLAAVEANVSEYFAKPFEDVHQLALRIAAAEERARLRREGKWLHAALVESEERYRKLFEAIPDAVVVFDARTQAIEDVNPAALELYGYQRRELLGRPATDLRAPCPEEVQDVSPFAQTAIAGVRMRRDRRQDGSVVHVELVEGRFHVREQDRVVEIVRDINERLQAEATRKELETRLRQSQKLEMLGQLAGGVAHDFNNLLAVILNYAQFVHDALNGIPGTHAGSSLRDDVEQILSAAHIGASLTKQLLGFSRREVFQADIVDVNTVVQATERLLRRTLGPTIDLCTHLADGLACVRMDRGQLEQIIVNLAVNARDAMPEGGRLTIVTRNSPAEDMGSAASEASPNIVTIEVSDTGQGMDAATLEHAFEPFFTTKERDRGTGLGLAMVKGIIERLGGCIDVTSEVGVGSCFRIVLPATRDQGSGRQLSQRPTQNPPHGELILVVDDEAAVRRAMVRILKRAGYQVVEADGSARALEKHQRLGASLSLVVTDVLMPEMSGEELVRRMRERQPNLRVLFVTGYATSAMIGEGEDTKQRAVLPKPFEQHRLLAVVREVLDVEDGKPLAGSDGEFP
jgi:two-component system cell cycle sensor histidine kinase/response regulator CckA